MRATVLPLLLVLGVVAPAARAGPGVGKSNDYVLQLFSRIDSDGNDLLDANELLEEYTRNTLPLTAGFEDLMQQHVQPHFPPLNASAWTSL